MSSLLDRPLAGCRVGIPGLTVLRPCGVEGGSRERWNRTQFPPSTTLRDFLVALRVTGPERVCCTFGAVWVRETLPDDA